MRQTVSVNGCHRDGCEPVCCVRLIGTSHQKHCPFPSPSPPLTLAVRAANAIVLRSWAGRWDLSRTAPPHLICKRTRPVKPGTGKRDRQLTRAFSTLLLLSAVKSEFALQYLGNSSCQKGKYPIYTHWPPLRGSMLLFVIYFCGWC